LKLMLSTKVFDIVFSALKFWTGYMEEFLSVRLGYCRL
jgi:hypothetical protein